MTTYMLVKRRVKLICWPAVKLITGLVDPEKASKIISPSSLNKVEQIWRQVHASISSEHNHPLASPLTPSPQGFSSSLIEQSSKKQKQLKKKKKYERIKISLTNSPRQVNKERIHNKMNFLGRIFFVVLKQKGADKWGACNHWRVPRCRTAGDCRQGMSYAFWLAHPFSLFDSSLLTFFSFILQEGTLDATDSLTTIKKIGHTKKHCAIINYCCFSNEAAGKSKEFMLYVCMLNMYFKLSYLTKRNYRLVGLDSGEV